MSTVRDMNADIDPSRVSSFGKIRRMILTTKVLWQLRGFTLPGADPEVFPAEPFTGIGIYARPPAGSKPEAIVVNVGGATAPVIIAVRDEQTRAAAAGNIAAGETMVYTPLAMLYLKSDGTIEARSLTGTAGELATKQDLAILRAALDTAVIALGANGAAAVGVAMDVAVAALPVPPAPPTWPIGTKKLKGE